MQSLWVVSCFVFSAVVGFNCFRYSVVAAIQYGLLGYSEVLYSNGLGVQFFWVLSRVVLGM